MASKEHNQEKKIRQRLKDDFVHYAEKCLKIRPKAGRANESFTLNKTQRYLHGKLETQKQETGKVRAIVLKGRQQGCSTYTEGRYYWKVTHSFGVRAYILTHLDQATDNLYRMVRRFHDNCPAAVKPVTQTSNAKELLFGELDSGYRLGTAKSEGVGRSDTIQYFHGCLAEGTLVLSPDGRCVPIESLNVGDNVVTHTGSIAPISFISTQYKECLEVSVFGISVPIVASKEHRFITQDGKKELKNISLLDWLCYPIRKIESSIHVLNFGEPVVKRSRGGGVIEHVPDSIDINYDLGVVVGLFLAKGGVKFSKSRAATGVVFSVDCEHVPRTIAWLDKVNHLFKSVSVDANKNYRSRNVIAYGKSFAVFMLRLVGCVDSKQLPSNWWLYSEGFVRGIVHGYLLGDGYSSKRDYDRRITAQSIRESITFGIRDALAALGYGWATISYREAGVRHGRNEKAKWMLRLSGPGVDVLCKEVGWRMPERRRVSSQHTVIKDGFVWLPIKSISAAGRRKVYDLEVDHANHSYCLPQCASSNSEVALWRNAAAHAEGIFQAVPKEPGTEVILESTARGMNNYFHQFWQMASDKDHEYEPIFIPWFWQSEYSTKPPNDFEISDDEKELARLYELSDSQIYWRRQKIREFSAGDGEKSFKQEYPCNANEAFQSSNTSSFIDSDLVMEARKCYVPTQDAPLLIGVDPARFGPDRSAIIRRKGREAYKLETYNGKDTMQLVGLIHEIIKNEKPAKVFIDVIGIGSGVVDRLRELGFRDIVIAVNSSQRALKDEKYNGKRMEMWGELLAWLEDKPCQIPDSNELHEDLCSLAVEYDSNSRYTFPYSLEKKEDAAKKVGYKSPDCADALALTFALPVSSVKKRPLLSDTSWVV